MIKKIKKLLKNQKGLTLVELLAVVVILGIISAIAVPSIGNVIENSKKDAHIANAQQIANAAKLAKASGLKNASGNTESYTLDELIEGGFLDEIPKSPTNSSYNSTYSKVYFTDTVNNVTVKQVDVTLASAQNNFFVNTRTVSDSVNDLTRNHVDQEGDATGETAP
ncbi:prepilin-type N-terminal cleavage/methylation domain-containing protein [Bacillus timonensis]|uniref:prepilin-type N-terminal cleavage/methylation domain-containing protein n=1 Tax=Bacillus timonensis TaxID=1033734 RepID=UPI00028866A7|nr:prepilin-type N-terminal cleavage/methylation domain-containing protein [Bacillus timonensis]